MLSVVALLELSFNCPQVRVTPANGSPSQISPQLQEIFAGRKVTVFVPSITVFQKTVLNVQAQRLVILCRIFILRVLRANWKGELELMCHCPSWQS